MGRRKLERQLIPCGCGCGEMILNRNKRGNPIRYKSGHFWFNKKRTHDQSGDKNPNWVGGKSNREKYILILMTNHPNTDNRGYVAEHRLVMEEHLGRYLTKDEIVHHINHNQQDNHIENLQLMTPSEHTLYHNAERRKEIDKRLCYKCNQNTTLYKNKTPCWFRSKEGWICNKCYRKDYWWNHLRPLLCGKTSRIKRDVTK